jgi:hypothetical protein
VRIKCKYKSAEKYRDGSILAFKGFVGDEYTLDRVWAIIADEETGQLCGCNIENVIVEQLQT